MKLSEHFSLAEMCKTSANLDNVPNEAQVENLKRLCGWLEMLRRRYNDKYVVVKGDSSTSLGMTSPSLSSRPSEARGEISQMRPRAQAASRKDSSASLGMTCGGEEPIRINSGYRSPQLNRAIGGAANSNHLTGCACDIRVSGMEQILRYAVILMEYADETKQDFDELLLERSPKGNYWLHFAVRAQGNRRKINFLKA